MTVTKLASTIAKREGKKSETNIGNIREILGILSDMVVEDMNGFAIYDCLIINGLRRAKKKPKKKV